MPKLTELQQAFQGLPDDENLQTQLAGRLTNLPEEELDRLIQEINGLSRMEAGVVGMRTKEQAQRVLVARDLGSDPSKFFCVIFGFTEPAQQRAEGAARIWDKAESPEAIRTRFGWALTYQPKRA